MTQNPFSMLPFGNAEGGRPDQPRVEGVPAHLIRELAAELQQDLDVNILALRAGEQTAVSRDQEEDYYGQQAA